MKRVLRVSVVLAAALGIVVSCQPNKTEAPTVKEAQVKEAPMPGPPPAAKNKHHKPIKIIVDSSGVCSVDQDPIQPSKKKKEFLTWKLTPSSVTGTYVVKFKAGQGTPCDGQDPELVMDGGGDETTACTVQKVSLHHDPTKPDHHEFKYGIFVRDSSGHDTACMPDPSVDVQQ